MNLHDATSRKPRTAFTSFYIELVLYRCRTILFSTCRINSSMFIMTSNVRDYNRETFANEKTREEKSFIIYRHSLLYCAVIIEPHYQLTENIHFILTKVISCCVNSDVGHNLITRLLSDEEKFTEQI